MSSLQKVTLQVTGADLDMLELENIAAGFKVQLAWSLRYEARRNGGSAEYLAGLENVLWRRICELLELQCVEVHA